MKTNTVKGTNDYLPSQVELRDYLLLFLDHNSQIYFLIFFHFQEFY